MRFLVCSFFLCASAAHAQEPIHRFAGPHEVRLDASAEGAVLHFRGQHVRVARGDVRYATLAARPDAALAVLVMRDEVRATLVELDGARLGASHRLRLPRGDAALSPYVAIATDDDQGFAFLWQSMGPGRGAQTHMARVDADATWLQAPAVVPVPWALGAIAFNGRGYHLALYYDGAGPGQTRLSMVSLSRDGRPEQHPDWSSAPGFLQEVQLVRHHDRVLAYYRGGSQGETLFSVDVTRIGQWARERGGTRRLGPLPAEESFALRLAAGEVRVVRH